MNTMRKRGLISGFLVTLVATAFAATFSAPASAQYSGTSYKMEEAQVGAVGADNELSTSTYKGRAGLGDTGVGIVSGTTYQAVGGFTTSDTPELEMSVNTANVDLGVPTASTTGTGVASFNVRAYLASSYTVYTRGGLPTQEGGATIPGMSVAAAPTVGTEQFGINLVANTTPAALSGPSKDPLQVADNTYGVSTFGFGTASAGYNTANQYKYVDGDAVAGSTKSSGVTTYTISYVVNVATVTRAGTYTLAHQMIVVATY
jgi:hypothetical protein